MSITTEDGTGLAGAETYISVTDADTRMAARGFALWATMSTNEKEQALRRSTDFMEANYGDRWDGYRVGTTQALSWPRQMAKRYSGFYGVTYYDSNIVPVLVKNACCELAYRGAASDLSPDLTAQVLSEKVGSIEVQYAPGARQQTKYQAVENMLSPLFSRSSNSIGIARA